MKHLPVKDETPGACASSCSRRQFASVASAAAAGFLLTGCGPRRLREMPKERLRQALDEMEREYAAKRGVAVKVADTPPAAGRALRLRARSVPLHRLPALRLRLRRGEQPVARPADPLDPRAADGEGEGRRLRATPTPTTTRPRSRRQATSTCRSPASSAATRRASRPVRPAPPGTEPDGIVVIDYDWCIGCRCCMAACPYGARHFNWTEPSIPKDELNPATALPRQPAAPQGRGREVHLLHPARAQGTLPRLRRGVPGGRAQVRQPAG